MERRAVGALRARYAPAQERRAGEAEKLTSNKNPKHSVFGIFVRSVKWRYATSDSNLSISARIISRLERQKSGSRMSMPKRAARLAAPAMPVEESRSS